MKILTLSILAGLTLAASASPERAGVAYEVPGTEYRTTTVTTTRSEPNILLIDTASAEEELDAPARTPLDEETLLEINGDPGQYSNRDLEKQINRTYDQKKNIESDYGKEIKREILDDHDKWNDAKDGVDDDY